MFAWVFSMLAIFLKTANGIVGGLNGLNRNVCLLEKRDLISTIVKIQSEPNTLLQNPRNPRKEVNYAHQNPCRRWQRNYPPH